MNISTTVAAQGQAEAPHNLAHFHVVLKDNGTTVPSAKARLKKQVDEFMAALDAMKQKFNVEFVKNSLHTNSNVQEQWEWVKNDRKFRGYEATYTVSFTIDDLDKVSEVYDALTNLNKVAVSHPWFTLKNMDRLNKKALKKAWENVQARFEEECSILGLNAEDFEVGTWETTYSDSRRSDRVSKGVRAFAAAAPAGGAVPAMEMVESAALNDGGEEEDTLLEITPGNATVTVNLEVGYIRRANTTAPVKATVVEWGKAAPASTLLNG